MESNFVIQCPMEKPTIKIGNYIINKYVPVFDLDYIDGVLELKSKRHAYEPKNEYLSLLKNMEYLLSNTVHLFDMVGIYSGIYYSFDEKLNITLHEFNRIDKSELKPVNEYSKYQNVIYTMHRGVLYNILKPYTYVERIEIIIPLFLKAVEILYDRIEIGGNYLFSMGIVAFENQIEMIHLLSYLFKKITIYGANYIYCEFFLGEEFIPKSKYLELLHSKFKFKNIEYNLVEYFKSCYDYYGMLSNYLLNEDVDNYIKHIVPSYYKKILSIKVSDEIKDIFYKILTELFNQDQGKENLYENKPEKIFIQSIIKKNDFRKCLEIGFDFGVNATYILTTFNDVKLISIDPYESTEWNNIGVKLLKKIKLNKRHEFIEKYSYEILPKFLKNNDQFDFILMNNRNKRFDSLLVDFFYSFLLLRKGGMIIINDSGYNGCNKLVKYIETNYLFFKKIDSPSRMTCFKKISEDTRDWDFHKQF